MTYVTYFRFDFSHKAGSLEYPGGISMLPSFLEIHQNEKYMAATKLVSITEYLKTCKKKMSRQWASNAAKKGSIELLPGVISAKKFGRNYLLEVVV